jgi:hypothetical protein
MLGANPRATTARTSGVDFKSAPLFALHQPMHGKSESVYSKM